MSHFHLKLNPSTPKHAVSPLTLRWGSRLEFPDLGNSLVNLSLVFRLGCPFQRTLLMLFGAPKSVSSSVSVSWDVLFTTSTHSLRLGLIFQVQTIPFPALGSSRASLLQVLKIFLRPQSSRPFHQLPVLVPAWRHFYLLLVNVWWFLKSCCYVL